VRGRLSAVPFLLCDSNIHPTYNSSSSLPTVYSPRYIFTKLEKITRAIFHPDDDALLTYLHEDGDSIEPEFYMPVIPMLLVNGADGIGTGWSTNIPNFNPREVIANLRRKIKGEEMEQMHPHFFGFYGDIEEDSKKSGSYVVTGKIERVDDETLFISELPVKSWTQDYKAFLEKLMTGVDAKPKKTTDTKKKPAEKKEPEIRDFKENHTDTTVAFTITASKDQIDEFETEAGGLYAKFKLTSKLATSNMNAFDEHNRIIKFDTAKKILDYFYGVRVEYYIKRKDHMLANMRREQRILNNKARFIEEVCSGDLIVSNRKRSEILSELKERDYELFPKQIDKKQNNADDEAEIDDAENSSDAELAKGYEYLLGMKIWSLTFEKAEKLRQELAEKTKAVSDLEATSPTSLWEADLDALDEALDERDQYFIEAAKDEVTAQNKSKKSRANKKTTTKRPVKKHSDDDDSDDDFVVAKKKPATKKVAAKKPAATKVVASSSSSTATAPVTKKVAAASSTKTAPLPKKAASKPPLAKKPTAKKLTTIDLDSDSEPEESMSLMDRMRQKTSKPAASSAVSNKPTKSKKRASPKANDSDPEELDSFDTATYEPAALTPAPKKSKVSRAPINLDDDSDDDMFDDALASKSKATKPAAASKAPKSKPARKTVQKKIIDFSDDDDEEEFDEDASEDDFVEEEFDEDASEDDFVPAPAPSRSRGARATTKKAVYADSDSDEDSGDDLDFDE